MCRLKTAKSGLFSLYLHLEHPFRKLHKMMIAIWLVPLISPVTHVVNGRLSSHLSYIFTDVGVVL